MSWEEIKAVRVLGVGLSPMSVRRVIPVVGLSERMKGSLGLRVVMALVGMGG